MKREARRRQQLMQIVHIREAQRNAAERAAVEADRALRDAEQRCQEEAANAQEVQDSWRQVVAGSSLRLDLCSFWARAVVAGEAKLHAREAEAATAEQRRSEAMLEHKAASARADVAEEFAKAANHAIRRRAEEDRLSELADRTALAGYSL